MSTLAVLFHYTLFVTTVKEQELQIGINIRDLVRVKNYKLYKEILYFCIKTSCMMFYTNMNKNFRYKF